MEEFLDLIEIFESKLGVNFNIERIKSLPKNVNNWQGDENLNITWESLKQQIPIELYKNIQGMAFRYGYSTCNIN